MRNNLLDRKVTEAVPGIVKNVSGEMEGAVLAEEMVIQCNDSLIECTREYDCLERRSGFEFIRDDPVPKIPNRSVAPGLVGIEAGQRGHGQNLSRFGTDDDRRSAEWQVAGHRCRQLGFHDALYGGVER